MQFRFRELALAGLLLGSVPLAALNIQAGYQPGFIDPLPNELRVMPQPAPLARAVILIEAETGTILFEKDADAIIPPASLTKLLVMALAYEHLARNGIAADSVVEISPRAWASAAPARSSLMFLAPNQTVTWEDLLLGLAVVSGNDAAVAIAENVDGSVEAFVDHMNRFARELGLKSTVFVEPSGYSEENLTSARDLGYFLWYYLKTWPEAIARYHSQRSFVWPRDPGKPEIAQYNKNRLLSRYPGADGFKTGYIDESGYNLAYTAQRGGMRLLGLVLGGTADRARFDDAISLMDYGFNEYRLVELKLPALPAIRIWNGAEASFELSAATARAVVPASMAQGLVESSEVLAEIEAPLSADRVLGWTRFGKAGAEPLLAFPRRAGRAVESGGALVNLADTAFLWVRQAFGAAWPPSGVQAPAEALVDSPDAAISLE